MTPQMGRVLTLVNHNGPKENDNAIFKTEIRRLNTKLEQASRKPEIIPVARQGGDPVVTKNRVFFRWKTHWWQVGHDGVGTSVKSQPPDPRFFSPTFAIQKLDFLVIKLIYSLLTNLLVPF